MQLIGCGFPAPLPYSAPMSVAAHIAKDKQEQLLHPKVSMVTNTLKTDTTKADYDKATRECGYEAKVATVDANYEGEQIYHKLHLAVARQELEKSCLLARGFINTESYDKKDIDTVKKYCPGYEVSRFTCFIPSIK